MRAWIGKYIAGVGILHTIVGLVVFRATFEDLLRDGVVNTVNWRPERAFPFWFVDIGLFWILLGAVIDHYEQEGIPGFVAWALTGLALAGVMVMPLTGWWLFFIPATALLFRARNRGATG